MKSTHFKIVMFILLPLHVSLTFCNLIFFCSREWRTRDLLHRYVSVEEEFNEQEVFVREKLGVPVEWIHYAKVRILQSYKQPSNLR